MFQSSSTHKGALKRAFVLLSQHHQENLTVDKIWGRMAKIGSFGRKPRFGAKKNSLLDSNYVLAMTGKSCAKKKIPFSQINISLVANLGLFF